MATILNGKVVSDRIKAEMKSEIETLKTKGINPGLAVVIVGEDPASKVYVANKEKACDELGMHSEKYSLPAETTQDELLELVQKLNKDDRIDGILCQLPLPKHIDEKTVIDSIDPMKDVDAFSAYNVGRIMIGDYAFVPCTPAGVMELIKESGIEIAGKECVVLGRSNIVGKPQALLLLQKDGTVTITHSKTRNLPEVTRRADIIVAAIGKPKFLTGDMVKPGAVVIDVGINRDENNKLCGDVDYESVEKVAGAITPVPGGVGPMTIAMLMKNTLTACKLHHGLDK